MDVQKQVRTLLLERPGLADEIRAATRRHDELVMAYRGELQRNDERLKSIVRAVLDLGCLRDPKLQDDGLAMFYRIRWPVPADRDAWPSDYPEGQPDGWLSEYHAALALRAIQHPNHAIADYPDAETSTMMRVVRVRRPNDWSDPPDPRRLTVENLRSFTPDEQRTIALFHLGGLADQGAIKRVVPRPDVTGDLIPDTMKYSIWRNRFPGMPEASTPDPRKLPPAIAEQFFREVVGLSEEDPKEEWWPISSFPAKLRHRIRQAAQPDRKQKVVRAKGKGHNKHYAVQDVRRHWPVEMGKP